MACNLMYVYSLSIFESFIYKYRFIMNYVYYTYIYIYKYINIYIYTYRSKGSSFLHGLKKNPVTST